MAVITKGIRLRSAIVVACVFLVSIPCSKANAVNPGARAVVSVDKALNFRTGYRPIGRDSSLKCVFDAYDAARNRSDGQTLVSNGLAPRQTTVLPISKNPTLTQVNSTWNLQLSTTRAGRNSSSYYGIVLYACRDNGTWFADPKTGLPFFTYQGIGQGYGFNLDGLPICGYRPSPCVNSIAISGPQPIYTNANQSFTYPSVKGCESYGNRWYKNSHPSAPWFDNYNFEGGDKQSGAVITVTWSKGNDSITAAGRPNCNQNETEAALFRTQCSRLLNDSYDQLKKAAWGKTITDGVASYVEYKFPKAVSSADPSGELTSVAVGTIKTKIDGRFRTGVIKDGFDKTASFKSNPSLVLPARNTGIANLLQADMKSNDTLGRLLEVTPKVPGAAWVVDMLNVSLILSNNYLDYLRRKEFVRSIARTLGCQWVHAEVYGSGS